MGRPLELLILSEGERVELGALAARHKTAQALALRARIVFLSGDGIANKDVAARLGVDPVTVGKWRRRFLEGGARRPRRAPRDMDTYATHKTPLIRDWLVKRPRWPVHHTPTGASWINQVERFFALLSEHQIKRGVHRSVAALQAAIAAFVDAHNADPKPFRWTKSADDILAAIERFCFRIIPAKMPRTSGSGH